MDHLSESVKLQALILAAGSSAVAAAASVFAARAAHRLRGACDPFLFDALRTASIVALLNLGVTLAAIIDRRFSVVWPVVSDIAIFVGVAIFASLVIRRLDK